MASEFRTFVDRLSLRARYPEVLSIGFSKRLARGEKDAFVEKMRREFYPDFKLWPEHGGDDYHSVIYLEPLNRNNRGTIGYDMFTDPVCRAAMERSRDRGEPAASDQVTPNQELNSNHPRPDFLILVPVYGGGKTPPTMEERQNALVGFVYSPFDWQALLNGIFLHQNNPG